MAHLAYRRDPQGTSKIPCEESQRNYSSLGQGAAEPEDDGDQDDEGEQCAELDRSLYLGFCFLVEGGEGLRRFLTALLLGKTIN